MKYEYTTLRAANPLGTISLPELNQMAANGWRVVSAEWRNGGVFQAILERPVEEKKAVKG